MGQLLTIAQSASATETTIGILALLVIAAASWWMLRRPRREHQRPDVGAVSTHWLTQHRMSRPDGSH